jgi:hypothetical protein
MTNLDNVKDEFEIVLRDVFGSGEYIPSPNYFITDDHVGMCLFGALGYNEMGRPEHFYTSELVNTCCSLIDEMQYSGDFIDGWNDSFYDEFADNWYEGEAKKAYHIGHSLGKKMQEEFRSYIYESHSAKERREGIGF